MNAYTLGSLCTGYAGLDLAIQAAIPGTRTIWLSEWEPPTKATPKPGNTAAKVLARHYPDVPNLGDMTRIPWAATRRVTVMAAGYPCQGESVAGARRGHLAPTWMWPAYFAGIRELRPKLAVGENVRNHLNIGFWRVVADLQSIGYAVVWVVVAASDVGAPHRRERLFWLAYDEVRGAPSGLGWPFAFLTGGDWCLPDLFGGRPITRFPVAGAAYAGAAYAGAAYAGAAYAGAAPIVGELLVTPTANLGANGGSQHPDKRKAGGHGVTLADQVEHMLMPRASDYHGPGMHGRGGMDLRTAVTLLPTPDASHGRKETRTGPLLAGAVELLPTPTASAYGYNQSASEGAAVRPSLDGVVRALLPTPGAADGVELRRESVLGGTRPSGAKRSVSLFTAVDHLMPTPRATDGSKGGPNQHGSRGDLMLPSACQPERFGKFALAIARWEALTRPAPDPTIPGRTGKPRLNPAFSEWMMGLPDGWITGTPGVSTPQALKIAGNGVVPRQGEAALVHLLSRLVLPPSGR